VFKVCCAAAKQIVPLGQTHRGEVGSRKETEICSI
jgi:hypothetical protein